MSDPNKYTLADPNTDTVESNRLNFQHNIFIAQFNGALLRAPISPQHTRKVLDVGCGTGVWSMDFARRNASSQVLGVDVIISGADASEKQNSNGVGSAPPNCHFVQGNAEAPWDFAQSWGPFDLVYGRMLSNSIRHWRVFFEQALANLSPGGWFELCQPQHEFGCAEPGFSEENSAAMRWWRLVFIRGWERSGIMMGTQRKLKSWIEEAGFLNVSEEAFSWRHGAGGGPTEKEDLIGGMWVKSMTDLLHGVTATVALQGGDGLSEKEMWALCEEAKKDLEENGVKRGYYTEFQSLTAQKPEKL